MTSALRRIWVLGDRDHLTLASLGFVFPATVKSVHDGDTIHANIDQGLGTWNHGISARVEGMAIRFIGCNAAELGTPGGDAAAANLTSVLPPGTQIWLRAAAWDKYGGRLDADVVEVDGTDLIQTLIDQQWLAAWDGTGTRPVPPWPRTV